MLLSLKPVSRPSADSAEPKVMILDVSGQVDLNSEQIGRARELIKRAGSADMERSFESALQDVTFAI